MLLQCKYKLDAYSESFEIINEWLSKYNSLKQLDQRFDDRINRSLKTAIEKKFPPLSLETLREKNSELYYILLSYQIVYLRIFYNKV